jgi:hypothetical protein
VGVNCAWKYSSTMTVNILNQLSSDSVGGTGSGTDIDLVCYSLIEAEVVGTLIVMKHEMCCAARGIETHLQMPYDACTGTTSFRFRNGK